jgi:predicted O-methyltransferase YrrM
MEHFYHNIHGFFDFQDVYTRMVNEFGDGAHFVEVGAFYGRSTAYLAVEIANSNKAIKFDVVDTWRGSPEHQVGAWDYQEAMVNDTAFDVFKNNLKPAEGYYNPIKMGSLDAAKLYPDNSLDMVFIDADHSYEAVKEDIAAWYPKVKVGGYLCGHDFIAHNPDDTVNRAVTEIFGSDIQLSHVTWIKKKV